MAKHLIVKKEDTKKNLKINIDKKLHDQIQKIREDIKLIDKSMNFNLDGVIESAVKRAVKAAKHEIDALKKLKTSS